MNVAKTTVISLKALVTIIYYLEKKKKSFQIVQMSFFQKHTFSNQHFLLWEL